MVWLPSNTFEEGDKVEMTFSRINSWETLFVPMVILAIWFEKCPCRISKSHGLVLIVFGFAFMLMTSSFLA
jgi:hypothetical protein